MDYRIGHRCEHLRSGWASSFTLEHLMRDGRWNVTKFSDNNISRVFATRAMAEDRNRQLAINWLLAEDPGGAIYEPGRLEGGRS